MRLVLDVVVLGSLELVVTGVVLEVATVVGRLELVVGTRLVVVVVVLDVVVLDVVVLAVVLEGLELVVVTGLVVVVLIVLERLELVRLDTVEVLGRLVSEAGPVTGPGTVIIFQIRES